jgi:pimeloyl-ACP methyl ester carboxylesterase
MNAGLHAYEHPEEVAGLVLVDGSHQDQFTRSVEALPEPEPNSPDSHKGFYRFWAGGGWRDPANNPENVDFLRSREQLRAIHSLVDLPVVVLVSEVFLHETPTRPEAGPRLHEIWQDLQRELANLSSNGIYSVLESSGHFIQRDRPEAVMDAIRRVLDSASEA